MTQHGVHKHNDLIHRLAKACIILLNVASGTWEPGYSEKNLCFIIRISPAPKSSSVQFNLYSS